MQSHEGQGLNKRLPIDLYAIVFSTPCFSKLFPELNPPHSLESQHLISILQSQEQQHQLSDLHSPKGRTGTWRTLLSKPLKDLSLMQVQPWYLWSKTSKMRDNIEKMCNASIEDPGVHGCFLWYFKELPPCKHKCEIYFTGDLCTHLTRQAQPGSLAKARVWQLFNQLPHYWFCSWQTKSLKTRSAVCHPKHDHRAHT